MEVPSSDDERETSHLPLKRKVQVHVSISFQIQCSFDYIIHPKSSVLRCTHTQKNTNTSIILRVGVQEVWLVLMT